MRIYAWLVVFLLSIGSANSDAMHSSALAVALLDGDHEALNQIMEDMTEKARETGDFTDVRQAFATLFQAADGTRYEKARAWQDAYPESPYAATAMAWAHIGRAHLFRGNSILRNTSAESLTAFRGSYRSAAQMVDLGLQADPDFPPALDAAIQVRLVHGNRQEVLPILNHLMEVAPDHHGINLAMNTFRTAWGGELSQNLVLCTGYAARVADYGAEECLVEVAFMNNAKGPLRRAALNALDRSTSPYLNNERLEAYLGEWRTRPEAAEEVARLHQEALQTTTHFGRSLQQADWIRDWYGRPFYAAEAQATVFARMREMLDNAPQDHVLASDYISRLKSRGQSQGRSMDDLAEEFASLWPGMVALGSTVASVWDSGMTIMQLNSDGLDHEALAPFAHNAIYYSNHDPSHVYAWMRTLHHYWEISEGSQFAEYRPGESAEDYQAEILCPMVRASIVFEAICQESPHLFGCKVGGYQKVVTGEVRMMARTTDLCSSLKEADPRSLVFQSVEVPVDVFEAE